LNRKTFDEKVLQIIAAQRSNDTGAATPRGACLAVVDIDHFKSVNDRFGHLYGDEILLLFSQAMMETFRGADLLFRVGGEEFVIVLKDVDLERALFVLERFRRTIEEKSFPQVGTITASIGASAITANDLSTSIIDRADKALYYAKSNGRNQVHAYENLVAAGKLTDAKHDSTAELF
jgi:diguanylate cyclase (GGDEF)-like protein